MSERSFVRVINQDGTIDVPYNFFSLSVASGKCKDVEYACIYCHNISAPHGTKLAEYSSKEKALKAMQMLRNEFADYGESGIFRFPQNNEIEV